MKTLTSLIAASVFAFSAFFAVNASAQVEATTITTALSNVVTCAHVTTNVVNARAIDVQQGKGLAVTPYFRGTQSSNTQTIAFFFAPSYDGTNYTTTTPIRVASTGNGNAAVRDYILIPPTTLDHVRKIKLITITNGLDNMAALHVTNLYITIRN